jgi:hypothetical protein
MSWGGQGGGGEAPFYRTLMGRRLIEHTLPEGVRQLTRLADELAKFNGLMDRLLDAFVETQKGRRDDD